jgi:cysteine desulfurase
MGLVYLDHLAATPLHPRVKEAMIYHMEHVFGNPSSDHQIGHPAAEALDLARNRVAALINADPKEIVFTSGGTEANNLAIKGLAIALREKGRHIITSNIEHKSVLNSLRTLRLLDYRVTSLDVDEHGLVDPAAVEKAITKDTILISIQLANNEIGTIEPVADIAKIARKHKIAYHTDAVAAVGIIPVDVKALDVSLMSLAANQFYGPAGVGALYVRKGTPVWPLLDGGVQENKRRAGAENLIGIVGRPRKSPRACPALRPLRPAWKKASWQASRKSRSTAIPPSACHTCCPRR